MASRRSLAAAAAALACAAAAAPAAYADSISYIKDGDVFLTTPDGSRTHQVTTTGGYSSASQADDGRILALKGGHFQLMDQWGTVQSDFSPVAAGTAGTITLKGPFDPAISPDGTRVAYGFYVQYTHGDPNCGLPGGCWEGHLYAGTGYSPSTGPADWSDDAWKPSYGWIDPSWIDGSRTLVSGPSSAYLRHTGIDTLGDDKHEATGWFNDFSDGSSVLYDGEMNRAHTGVAFVVNTGGEQLRVYRMTSEPADGNAPEGCLSAPSRGSAYESPSWSPDGSRLAFSDASGIYVADVPGLAQACPKAEGIKVVTIAPGGRKPDWGPADLPDPSTSTRPAGGSAASGGASGGAGTAAPGAPVNVSTPGTGGAKPALKLAGGKGLTLRLTVPAAGRLSAVATRGRTRVATAAARSVKAGTVTLKLKRTKAARRVRGKLTVRVTFTPKGGAAQVVSVRR